MAAEPSPHTAPAPAGDGPSDAPSIAPPITLSAAETEGLSPQEIEALRAQKAREAALRKLMDRISAKADFPSLRDSIRTIQTISRSETAHLRALGDLVSGDVAVTGKLLRVINAAFYRSAGGGTITSLPKAIAIMGLQPFTMLVSSLKLFERLPTGPGTERIQRQFSQGLMAGLLAHELCHSRQHFEQAFLAGLFMNLGQMLAALHFPDEFHAIEDAVELAIHEWDDHAEPAAVHDLKERESRQVFGISFEELGIEIARQWGWPETVVAAMRRQEPQDTDRAADSRDYLRVLCTAVTDLSDQLHRLPAAGNAQAQQAARSECLARFGQRLGPALSIDTASMATVGEEVHATWAELSTVVGIKAIADASASGKPLQPAGREGEPPPLPSKVEVARMDKALASAVGQVAALLEQGCSRDELYEAALGAMQSSLGLERALLALLNPREGELLGATGSGRDIEHLIGAFRITLGDPQDLFSLLCTNAKDALISDAREATVAKRIPLWHLTHFRARTFLLLPIQAGGRVIGTLYGDRQQAGSLHVSETSMQTLQDLRKLIVKGMSRPVRPTT